jgi:phage shock protein C
MMRNDVIPKHRLYRARDGLIFGVCAGLADWLGIARFWSRFAVVVIFLFTGFWPVAGIYLASALLLRREPRHPSAAYRAAERADRRSRACRENLDARIRNLEDMLTE